MALTSLAYLPREILSRIARSGPAESVLALAKTCRALYHACYDTLVFKDIFESQRLLWNDPGTLDVPTLSGYIDSDDTQAWARFAMADQRAIELREVGLWLGTVEVVKHNRLYLEGFRNWAPHLFVTRHPLMRMPWYRLRSAHKPPSRVSLESIEGIFCSTAALLCTRMDDLYEIDEDWLHDEGMREINDVVGAMRMLCAFAIILKLAICEGQMERWLYNQTLDLVVPPSALNIPMQPIDSTYRLPIPFSVQSSVSQAPDSWGTWFTNHVKNMSCPVYLETGRWCGYYGYDSITAFDPPMFDIQFTVDQNHDPGMGLVWKIHAQGRDGIGRFTLEGWNTQSLGRLNLRKTYVGAHSFDWECFMTPFGIFGVWGERPAAIFHRSGKLWLWKREWNSP